MKDICEGRRTKEEVVQESIMMYREVFMKANREINVLVEVIVILYREVDLDLSTISQLDFIDNVYCDFCHFRLTPFYRPRKSATTRF